MNKMDLLVHECREALARRGRSSMLRLMRSLTNNNNRNEKMVDYIIDEFLRDAGIFLSKGQLNRIIKLFPSYAALAEALPAPLSIRRAAMIRQIFESIDITHSDCISYENIYKKYHSENCATVLTGQHTPQQAQKILEDCFMPINNQNNNNNATIDFVQFLQFFKCISTLIEEDDIYFIKIMEREWGIKEEQQDIEITAEVEEKILNLIREKLRHKSMGLSIYQLSQCFYAFDIDHSGEVNFNEFVMSLQSLGICETSVILEYVFQLFDHNNNGELNYNEFIVGLFKEQMNKSNDGDDNDKKKEVTYREHKEYNITKKQNIIRDNRYNDTSTTTTSNINMLSGDVNIDNDNIASVPQIIFIFGGPGAGNSSVCQHISNDYGFIHLDIPTLLQYESKNIESKEGFIIRECLHDNRYIPPHVTVTLIRRSIDYLSQHHDRYFYLLDGFPRTVEHLQEWSKQKCGGMYNVPFVLYLECDKDIRVKRLINNGETESSIQERTLFWENFTKPLINVFNHHNKLEIVNTNDNDIMKINYEASRIMRQLL